MEGKTKEGKIVLKSKSDKNVLRSLAMMDKMMGLLIPSTLVINRKRCPLEVNAVWKCRCNLLSNLCVKRPNSTSEKLPTKKAARARKLLSG